MYQLNLDQPTARKKIVKRISAGFILIMIFFTFFSKTLVYYKTPKIITARVVRGNVQQSAFYSGTVLVKEDVSVIWNGRDITVKNVLSSLNSDVNSGDTIVECEVYDLWKDLEMSRMSCEQAALVLEKYDMDVKDKENRLEQLKQELSILNNELDMLLKGYLVGDISLADSDINSLVKKIEAAKENKKDSLEATIAQKKSEIEKLEADLAGVNSTGKNRTIYETDYELKKAELERKEAEYEMAKAVKSPVSGKIVELKAASGKVLKKGDTVFTVRPPDYTYSIELKLKKDEYEKLGNRFMCTVQLNYQTLQAVVERVEEADDGYTIYLSFDDKSAKTINLKGMLQKGDKIKVKLEKTKMSTSMLVPNNAIVMNGDQAAVYIVKERKGLFGKEFYVELADVSTGESDNAYTEVNGLQGEISVAVYWDRDLPDRSRVIIQGEK